MHLPVSDADELSLAIFKENESTYQELHVEDQLRKQERYSEHTHGKRTQ